MPGVPGAEVNGRCGNGKHCEMMTRVLDGESDISQAVFSGIIGLRHKVARGKYQVLIFRVCPWCTAALPQGTPKPMPKLPRGGATRPPAPPKEPTTKPRVPFPAELPTRKRPIIERRG